MKVSKSAGWDASGFWYAVFQDGDCVAAAKGIKSAKVARKAIAASVDMAKSRRLAPANKDDIHQDATKETERA